MPDPPRNPRLASPAELKERIAAERRGERFLIYRDGDGAQRISALAEDVRELTIGRDPEADVQLGWDPQVSGLHAELLRAGGSWLVIDDGLSRNGTCTSRSRPSRPTCGCSFSASASRIWRRTKSAPSW